MFASTFRKTQHPCKGKISKNIYLTISQNKKEYHSIALWKAIQGYSKPQQKSNIKYYILMLFGSCWDHKGGSLKWQNYNNQKKALNLYIQRCYKNVSQSLYCGFMQTDSIQQVAGGRIFQLFLQSKSLKVNI